MKRIIIPILMLAGLTGCGGKKPIPASRLQQPAGAFSFVTPDDWCRTTVAGLDFIIVSTDSDYGSRPNIFVDSVQSPGVLADLAPQLIESNLDNYRAYQVAQQSDFVTDSGLTGIKISARRKNKDALPLTTFHYLIQDNTRVITITCTCAEPAHTKYEHIFDKALKSLETEESQQ